MTATTLYAGLVLAGIAVLQSTILRFIEIAGVAPDLVLIALVFVANKNGRMTGQLVGFIGGVVLDVLGLAPLGFYAVIYTLLGAIFGSTRGKMFVDPIFIPVVLTVVALLFKGLFAIIIGALFSVASVQGQVLTSDYLIEIVYSGLLGPVLFALLGLVAWLQPDRRKGEIIS